MNEIGFTITGWRATAVFIAFVFIEVLGIWKLIELVIH